MPGSGDVTKNTVATAPAERRICEVRRLESDANWASGHLDLVSAMSCEHWVSTNEGTSVTALQDWLNIRSSFDPRTHVRTFICALRGVSPVDAGEVASEPVFIRPGLERC